MKRFVLAVLCLGLAALSLWSYRVERGQRRGATEAAERFHFPERRPLDFELLPDAPSPDMANDVFTLGALSDASGRVRLSDFDPEVRALWLETVRNTEEELQTARALQLDAVALRPGLATHRYLLGKVEYLMQRRERRAIDIAKWLVPLESAVRADPIDLYATSFLASTILENWTILPPPKQTAGIGYVRRALEQSRFARAAFPAVVQIFGTEQALKFMPDSAEGLRAASGAIAQVPELLDTRIELEKRWRAAEWNERQIDLQKIARRIELEDDEGARAACDAWMSRHPLEDFDDEAGRRQAARLAGYWPEHPTGPWGRDNRTKLINYFLDGRTSAIDAQQLGRLAGSLYDVPEVQMARLLVIAGKPEAAEEMMRRAASRGSFEWTPVAAAVASAHLQKGDTDAATEALRLLAPSAMNECDILLVRRELAERLKKPATDVESSLASEPLLFSPADFFNGTMSLCADPRRYRGKSLHLTLAPAARTLVGYGWDNGTHGVADLRAPVTVRVPVDSVSGRRQFTVRAIAGPSPGIVGVEVR